MRMKTILVTSLALSVLAGDDPVFRMSLDAQRQMVTYTASYGYLVGMAIAAGEASGNPQTACVALWAADETMLGHLSLDALNPELETMYRLQLWTLAQNWAGKKGPLCLKWIEKQAENYRNAVGELK